MDIYPSQIANWSRSKIETAIRRRVQTAYLGKGLVLARILGRHKIFLQSSDRGFACHVMLDGFWEMWLTQFLAQHAKPGMTAIDVGANFGYYSLLLADAVGAAGKVMAIEPNPATFSLLQETMLLNGYQGRATLVPQALSDRAGSAWLFCPHGEPKNALLVDAPGHANGTTVEVPTVTLDSLALALPKVDLIKIDAEGAEVAIVDGMRGLIGRDHPLIVLEFNAARYPDPKGFLESLSSAYRVTRELTPHGQLIPADVPSLIDKSPAVDRLLVFQ